MPIGCQTPPFHVRVWVWVWVGWGYVRLPGLICVNGCTHRCTCVHACAHVRPTCAHFCVHCVVAAGRGWVGGWTWLCALWSVRVRVGLGGCVCMWGLLHTDVYACVHTRTNVHACVHVCAHMCVRCESWRGCGCAWVGGCRAVDCGWVCVWVLVVVAG